MTMNFAEASRYARDMNKRVRRMAWPNNDFLIFVPAMGDMEPDGLFRYEDATSKLLPYAHLDEDDTATDWEGVTRRAPDHPDFTESQRAIPLEEIVGQPGVPETPKPVYQHDPADPVGNYQHSPGADDSGNSD